jgi:hypothetical protein
VWAEVRLSPCPRAFPTASGALLRSRQNRRVLKQPVPGRPAVWAVVRRQTESALWGIPESALPHARPKYGYLHSEPDGLGATTPADLDVLYGSIMVRFKPHVKARTTFTGADSLDDTDQGLTPGVAPTSLEAPSWTALHRRIGDAVALPSAAALTEAAERTVWYVEAQFHGALAPADIAEVVFKHPPGIVLQGLLAAQGIPWRVL